MSANFQRLLWAVDVFEETDHRQILFLLGALARATNAEIIPVYILSPNNSRIPSGAFAECKEAFTALAEKKMGALLSSLDIPTIRRYEILVREGQSTRQDAEDLAEFALLQGAEAIVAGTHARRGASRFFLGSFAETLLLTSGDPIFTVNPQTQVKEYIRRILLPTTFSSAGFGHFEDAVDLAKSLDAGLTLYYKAQPVSGGFTSQNLQIYLASLAVMREETAREWERLAANKGVRTEVVIDKTPGLLVPSIEKFAEEKNIDLIAVSTAASAAQSFVFGSVARQLVRSAPCPVWVQRNQI